MPRCQTRAALFKCTHFRLASSWPFCSNSVIHKTGIALRIASPPEKDRATTMDTMQKHSVNVGHVLPEICTRRQTDTVKETRTS